MQKPHTVIRIKRAVSYQYVIETNGKSLNRIIFLNCIVPWNSSGFDTVCIPGLHVYGWSSAETVSISYWHGSKFGYVWLGLNGNADPLAMAQIVAAAQIVAYDNLCSFCLHKLSPASQIDAGDNLCSGDNLCRYTPLIRLLVLTITVRPTF